MGDGVGKRKAFEIKGFFWEWRLDLEVAGVLFPPELRGLRAVAAGELMDVRNC